MSLLEQLNRQRLLAIVRSGDPDTASAIVDALADEGIDLVEVSLTTVGALSVIRRAATGSRGATGLGAGTVLTAADAQAALEAGASYLVTPGISEGAREGVRLGVPVLVGALTPTEVIAAVELGATAVKLFPVAQLGGPSYLRALRAPFPDVPFVPVGGVTADAVPDYLAAGAVAVGVGSPLTGGSADAGSLAALRQRARAMRAGARR
ncbi:aldolase [Actinoplanes sp. ATCC 53533]|uniref:bifunctional 4-hydroxy-2-oxoglutarate aldolase/2-dehydro-3-deoxy-phosphogluconate aldolase n=1 Tax=Actinoplanes sp. ATCC 53533 TaxID=1288362 RepID=UPI000F783131|nr:bifunctional 4-hydroxy-2-oxoglutarate aldolase/2-dehydro-3-deoxy-phosphogluconate aldolase [Actinoplanes sp. ATCC 53533]RSM63923.1 aldolase [Actinoplanes sp. ATCC 53533]